VTRSYGDSARVLDLPTQSASLKQLAELAQRASITPLVRSTAKKIIRNCGSRDDLCELQAIFDAVKDGDPDVAPFKNGFKYIADPRFADYFASPVDSIQECINGACGGDCDDHTSLIVALAASLGWKMGARAYGPKDVDGFSHVYAVAAYPKRPEFKRVVGMDTTVPRAQLGWEPPRGNVLTAWLE